MTRKHLLSGPSQNKLAEPWSNGTRDTHQTGMLDVDEDTVVQSVSNLPKIIWVSVTQS